MKNKIIAISLVVLVLMGLLILNIWDRKQLKDNKLTREQITERTQNPIKINLATFEIVEGVTPVSGGYERGTYSNIIHYKEIGK